MRLHIGSRRSIPTMRRAGWNTPATGGLIAVLLVATGLTPIAHAAPAQTPSADHLQEAGEALTLEKVNDAGLVDAVGPKSKGAAVLRAQILLDRARYSPGEIDGAFGSNMQKAIAAFQKDRELNVSGTVDAATWEALNRDSSQALISYTIAEADVAGPFVRIPQDMMAKSKLTALGYADPLEALGEKFHASPKLLQQLNPEKDLKRAGEQIVVPNVELPPLDKGTSVVVDKKNLSVTLLDASGKTLGHFPASVGSQHDPLPVGKWKIKGVANNPPFHYNPKLFWDADAKHGKAKIAPGPNNPVGVVWIDLTKEHYGIHGTPEPGKVGKTQSHGCIRMTNWDALALSQAVSPGTPATLK